MSDEKKQGLGDRRLAARLMAVQAVFQVLQAGQDYEAVRQEYLAQRAVPEILGEGAPKPDGALFNRIIKGVAGRELDLKSVLQAQMSGRDADPLLTSIVLCAAYELLAGDVDKPLIINDYLDIAHGYFEKSEVGLVNGLLDAVAKSI